MRTAWKSAGCCSRNIGGRGYASALTDRLIDRARQERKSVVIECAPAQEATKRIASKKGFRDCGICDGLALYRLP